MLFSSIYLLVSLLSFQAGASNVNSCTGKPQRRWGPGGFGNKYRPGNRVQVDRVMADLATGHGFDFHPYMPDTNMFILLTQDTIEKENGDKKLQYSIATWTQHGPPVRVQLAWAMELKEEPLLLYTTAPGATQACVEVDVGWQGLYLFIQTY